MLKSQTMTSEDTRRALTSQTTAVVAFRAQQATGSPWGQGSWSSADAKDSQTHTPLTLNVHMILMILEQFLP